MDQYLAHDDVRLFTLKCIGKIIESFKPAGDLSAKKQRLYTETVLTNVYVVLNRLTLPLESAELASFYAGEPAGIICFDTKPSSDWM